MAEQDIIALIRSDHDVVRGLLEDIEQAPADDRGALFEKLVGELARHEAAEEAIVHPTLRDEIAGGGAVTQQVLEQESAAESQLAKMEKMDPSSTEFLQAFRSLRADVEAHAEHEEAEEHPKLRDGLDAKRLQDMADGWEQLKKVAPTRPHPHTPQTPEVRAVAGPVVGAFDRARDAAREFFSR